MKRLFLFISTFFLFIYFGNVDYLYAQAKESIDELMIKLESSDPTDRAYAAKTLGELKVVSAVPKLKERLKSDPDVKVRGWCVRALAEIGTEDAIEGLKESASSDPDLKVRELAQKLLKEKGVDIEAPSSSIQRESGPPQVQTHQPPQQSTYSQTPIYVTPTAPPPSVVVTKPQKKPGKGLVVGGWSTFGGTYGAAIFVGSFGLGASWGWKFMLPIVGPVVVVATEIDYDDEYDNEEEYTLTFWCVIWTLAQAAGITMAIVGHSIMSKAEEKQEHGFVLTPILSKEGLFGLSFSGYF